MFYIKQGNIPDKRHIQHRDKDGSLVFEEHIFKPSLSAPTNSSNRVWLKMIKYPVDYDSDTEPYLGPPLLLS